MEKIERIKRILDKNELPHDIDTLSMYEISQLLRGKIILAVYRSAKAFARLSDFDPNVELKPSQIKSLATSAKAHRENVQFGFFLLKEIDSHRPKLTPKIKNQIPIAPKDHGDV